ncbi:MAG TPA: isopeptide-forming domain-containing fimbrial protein, partial [Acidimicrobiales bacterium]|nr:isopeptide-forming domain-containing fimbrial protein [Acidimicrobiales bacterium]
MATVAPTGASGTINVTEQAPASILYGTPAAVTLTASNPSASTPVYNLSYRDILPAGVSYVAGSVAPASAGAPTVIPNAPAAGQTTLVWSNVADLQPGSSNQISFSLRAVTGAQAATDNLLPGDTFGDVASAYVNSDPRFVPKFDAVTGQPVGGSYTDSATVSPPPSIFISPIAIAKSVPAPGGQLLRGVHDHAAVYTITVTNNNVNPTNTVTVDDWLPAALEFLGCPSVDSTTDAAGTNPGFTNEYPGAPALGAGLSTPSNCLVPSLVSTENDTPPGQPAGVYTHLQWSIGNLAAGTTATIRFWAGIPMRENSLTWSGAVPPTNGPQGANLDNNQGAETIQGLSITNQTQVQGSYQGPLGGGATNPVKATGSSTVQAADLAIQKSASPPGFQAGQPVTYQLDFQSGEYRYVASPVVTDIIPNGICPIDATTNYDAHSDPECNPVGPAPTITDHNTSVTTPLPYSSVTENANGTFTVVWDLPATLPPNANETITFTAMNRTYFQSNGMNAAPTLSGDTFNNSVTFTGTTDATCVNGGNAAPVPDPTCTTMPPTPIYSGETALETGVSSGTDTSAAAQSTPPPVLSKRIAVPNGDPGDCSGSTYISTDSNPPPTYQKGDKICFQLEMDFPDGISTRNPVLTDFLPPNTTFVSGSILATGANTVTQTADTSQSGSGVITWTLGDLNADGSYYAAPGQVFQVDLAVIANADPTEGNAFDLTGNLLKASYLNTAGQSASLRDQANYDLSWPLLGLTKGVQSVSRGGSTVAGPFGPNHDNVAVEDGDQVTYRVDLTNTGLEPATAVTVLDNLPTQQTCADVVPGSISNSGTCSGSTITWPSGAGITVPADSGGTPGTLELLYTTTVPAGTAAGEVLANHAGVASYQGTDDLGGTNTYYPMHNIDPTIPMSSWNTSAADDTSSVFLQAVGLTKTAAPQVTPQGPSPPPATIGEPVVYTVTATIPAGTNVYNATLTDPLGALPGAPLVEQSGTAAATLDGSPVGAGFTLTEASNTVTLTFPSTFTAPAGSPQTVVLTFSATVNDVAGNVAGATVTNTGNLAYLDSQSNPVSLSASAPIQIVEPKISMTKTDPNSGTGTPYPPGATVNFTLSVTNAAAASTAYGLVVTDVLPSGETVSGSPSNGGVVTAGPGPGESTITWTFPTGATIAPGGNQQLTYSATLPAQPVGSTTFTDNATANVASLDTSLYPGARTTGSRYMATAQDTVKLIGATVTKTVTPNQQIVGLDVTYTATVTIPANLSFPTFTAIDTLPDGMVFDSYGTATCQVSGGGSCGSDIVDTPLPTPTRDPSTGKTALAWFIGDVQAQSSARTVTLTYTAYPAKTYHNGVAVKPNDVLKNSVATYWNDVVGSDPTTIPLPSDYTHASAAAMAPLTIIAPTLSVAKTTSTTNPTPGVPFTYTVTVTNTGTVNAFDATVTDPVSPLLSDASNLTPSQGTASYNSGTRVITWNLSGQLSPGASATLTYTESLGPSTSIATSQSIPNTATVTTFYGVPASVANATPGRYDTYGPVSGSVSVHPIFPQMAVTKTTPAGSVAVMNQPFPWQFTLTNGTTAALSATTAVDVLPAYWTYVPLSTQITPASGSPITGIGAEPTISTNAVTHVQTLTWTGVLGPLANGQQIMVNYQATPTPGANLTPTLNVNTVNVTGLDGGGYSGNATAAYGASANASATINAADLAIVKSTTGLIAGAPNNAYTLQVTNNGPSSAAGPITVSDAAPAGTSFSGYSGGGWTCSIGTGGQSISCLIPGPLASGASANALTVDIDIPSSFAAPNITNTATVAGPTYDPNPANNTSTVTTPVGVQADLSITKSASGSFIAGSTGVYQLVVTNNGPSDSPTPGGPLLPITVTDTLPAGETFLSTTVSPNWVCGHVGQVVTCHRIVGLTAGQSSNITISVNIASNVGNGTTLTNTASVTGTIPDPNLANNMATNNVTVSTSADLSISKTHNPSDTFTPGTDIHYTLAVDNAGPSDAVNPTVSDTLPQVVPGTFLTFDSAGGGGWTCSFNAATHTVTCTSTNPLPAGTAAAPILLTVTIPSSVPTGTTVSNTATVTSSTADPNLNNNSSNDNSSAGSTSADVSIVKTHVGFGFTAGTNGVYNLVVANAGPSDAQNVSVTDTLPAGMAFVSGTGTSWTCTHVGQVVTCTLSGALAATTSTTITLTVAVATSTPPGVLTNTATVSSTTPDPDLLNNSSSDQVTVVTSADLQIQKSHTGLFTPGTNTSTYTLAVTNNGPSDAAGPVTTSDDLPGGLTFVSASGAGWSCSPSGQVVTCQLASGLTAGGASSVTLTVLVDPGYVGGPFVNTATVSSATSDPNPANNTSTDTTGPITPEADLSISKTHTGSFTAGQPASYQLVVTNNGPSNNAGNITVTDQLPAALTFVSATGAGWSCSFDAPSSTLTCTRALSLAAGVTAPTITLDTTISSTYGSNFLSNSATVASGTTNDPNPSNDRSTDVALVGTIADLSIVKTSTGTFVPGSNASYTLQVANNGPSAAAGPITVKDTLPVGLGYVSATGTGWTCNFDTPSNTLTCTQAADLPNGTSAAPITLTVSVGAAAYPTVANTASVSSSTSDDNLSNNTSTYTATVQSMSDLSIM